MTQILEEVYRILPTKATPKRYSKNGMDHASVVLIQALIRSPEQFFKVFCGSSDLEITSGKNDITIKSGQL